MTTTELRVELDADAVNAKLAEAQSVLERLPDGVADEIRERFADRIDLRVDLIPADDAATGSAAGGCELLGRYVAICPVLDELIAAAVGAANVGGADVVGGHSVPVSCG